VLRDDPREKTAKRKRNLQKLLGRGFLDMIGERTRPGCRSTRLASNHSETGVNTKGFKFESLSAGGARGARHDTRGACAPRIYFCFCFAAFSISVFNVLACAWSLRNQRGRKNAQKAKNMVWAALLKLALTSPGR